MDSIINALTSDDPAIFVGTDVLGHIVSHWSASETPLFRLLVDWFRHWLLHYDADPSVQDVFPEQYGLSQAV